MTDGTYSAGYSYFANSPLVNQIMHKTNTTTLSLTEVNWRFLLVNMNHDSSRTFIIRLIAIYHTLLGCALISASCLLVGCRLLQETSYVTLWRVADTQSNRIQVKRSVEVVANQLDFHPSTVFTNDLGAYVSREGRLLVWTEKELPLLFISDITNLPALALRLKDPGSMDQVSQYLRTRLSTNSLQLLSYYSGGTNAALQGALTKDLNRAIISKEWIYSIERFSGIKLSTNAINLIEQHPKGREVYPLNRLLLNEAYSDSIRSMGEKRVVVFFQHIAHTKGTRYGEIVQRMTEEMEASFGNEFNVVSSQQYF